MNGYSYILAKQIAWANSHDVILIGSKGARGRRAYTEDLDQNLFQPLLPEVRDAFAAGDGNELGSLGNPGKMQAVHSSSALGVNVFHYWKSMAAIPVIAAACGLCKRGSEVSRHIGFEEKFPIDDSFGIHPNIDVVIHNEPTAKIKCFAVECKFSEAYGAYKHGGLKQKYIDSRDIWHGLPHLRAFAERISPEDYDFAHLHPAQLVKHILGLNRRFGVGGFRLLYLWYDVLGEQGMRHREEIAQFAAIVKQDGIKFHSLSYQELIVNLQRNFAPDHPDYVRYLAGRYL